MLAGLCNLYEDFGFSNFSNLREMVQKLGAESLSDDLGSVRKSITLLQRYLKTKFSHQVLIYIFYNCNFLTCKKKFTKLHILYCCINHVLSWISPESVHIHEMSGFLEMGGQKRVLCTENQKRLRYVWIDSRALGREGLGSDMTFTELIDSCCLKP